MRLEEERAVEFVGTFLDAGKEELREEAGLALGASRFEAGIRYLQTRLQQCKSPDLLYVLIRGLGASRLESAIDCLVQIVKSGRGQEVLWSLQALEVHRESPKIWAEIASAVERRHEENIRAYFREHFPEPQELRNEPPC